MTSHRVAIVGFGSVGRRHAQNAIALGCDVTLVRRKATGNDLGLREVEDLDDVEADAFVIAVPTAQHAKTLQRLFVRRANVLCEKPACATAEEAGALAPAAAAMGSMWRVALQLRYHPLVEATLSWSERAIIGRVLYVHCAVGQYLPEWRPGRNHLESYSASTRAGGGVLLDLVHEVDLAACLSGPWSASAKGFSLRLSNVTIDAADIADLLWTSSGRALVHVHLDYLYRGLLRESIVIGECGAIRLDLANGILVHSGPDGKQVERRESVGLDRNKLFVSLMREFLDGLDRPEVCRLPLVSDHLHLQGLLWPLIGNHEQGEG